MFVTIGTNPDLTSPIGDAEQKGFRLHQMRLLVNPISGSIAGAGGVLFVLLFILKIMLVEIREDEVTFLLVFTLMIPMYLLILPLISLVGTLIDNSHPGKVKESVIHSCKYSVIGSLVFTFFLVLSIFLAIEADWGHFTEELGIDLPDMLLIVLICIARCSKYLLPCFVICFICLYYYFILCSPKVLVNHILYHTDNMSAPASRSCDRGPNTSWTMVTNRQIKRLSQNKCYFYVFYILFSHTE